MPGPSLLEVQFTLVAREAALAEAWADAFADVAAIQVEQSDILRLRGDAIVSPANSHGYMDGGIDLAYSQHFGWDLEKRLRAVLLAEHDGELPVGQAVVVETGRAELPFLISAPTMRVPMDVSRTAHAYLAFRGVLRAVREHNRAAPDRPIASVLCPGLGTGEGRMPPERCAAQMRYAYRVVAEQQPETRGGLAGAVRRHLELLGEDPG